MRPMAGIDLSTVCTCQLPFMIAVTIAAKPGSAQVGAFSIITGIDGIYRRGR
jgi:hypothetical protein